MIDIRNGELADILPIEFTRQPQVLGISYALKMAYQEFLRHQATVYVYAFIGGAPEYVLDLLAVELRVKYYNWNLDIDTKRDLIRTAIGVNMRDGTTYAVQTVIKTLFPSGSMEEWYQYGGDNNHFRVRLVAEECGFDVDELISSIQAVKRLSSKLDIISIDQSLPATTFYGALVSEQIYCTLPGSEYIAEYILDELDNYLLDELGNRLLSENGYSFG